MIFSWPIAFSGGHSSCNMKHFQDKHFCFSECSKPVNILIYFIGQTLHSGYDIFASIGDVLRDIVPILLCLLIHPTSTTKMKNEDEL